MELSTASLPRFKGAADQLRLFQLNFKRYVKKTMPGAEKVLEGDDTATTEEKEHVHLSLLMALEECEEAVAMIVRGYDDAAAAWKALINYYKHDSDEHRKNKYVHELVQAAAWCEGDEQDNYSKRVLKVFEKVKAVFDTTELITREQAMAWVLFAVFDHSKPKDFLKELNAPTATVNEMMTKVLHAAPPQQQPPTMQDVDERLFRMSAKRSASEHRTRQLRDKRAVCKWCGKFGFHRAQDCFHNPANNTGMDNNNNNSSSSSSASGAKHYYNNSSRIAHNGRNHGSQRHHQRRGPLAQRLEHTGAHKHVALKMSEHAAAQLPANAIGIDTQSSVHIFGNRTSFQHLRPLSKPLNVTGVGGAVTVLEQGTVCLKARSTDDSNVWLTIHNVLFLPGFQYDILSAGRLIDSGVRLCLSPGTSSLFVDGAELELACHGDSTFYLVATAANHSPRTKCMAVHTLHTWHRRLGHRSATAVRKALAAQRIDYVTGADKDCDHDHESHDDISCSDCLAFKASRKPVSKSAQRCAASAGDVLHLDVIGPFPPSIHGSKYAMVWLDEKTRFMECVFIKTKNDVCEALRRFIATTAVPVNRGALVQTDSDPVFTAHRFVATCKELGLRVRYSPPHVHQHNGLVERSIRTLKESAASMLHTSALPLDGKDAFWSAALDHAAWVYNLMPHTSIGTSPYHALFNKAPPIDQVRVFGCKAFIYDHVRTDKSATFPRRALDGHYIGYDARSNSHRVFVTSTQRVRSSINVDFVEEPSPAGQGGAFPASPIIGGKEQRAQQEEQQQQRRLKGHSAAQLQPTAMWLTPTTSLAPSTADSMEQQRDGSDMASDSMQQGDQSTADSMQQLQQHEQQQVAPVAMAQGDPGTADSMQQPQPAQQEAPDSMEQGDPLTDPMWQHSIASSTAEAHGDGDTIINSSNSVHTDLDETDASTSSDCSDDSTGYDTDILCLRTTLLKDAMVQRSQRKQPPVPTTWRKAMASPDKAKWQDAFVAEWQNMIRHDVFDIVEQRTVPLGLNAIPSKLVFAVKHNVDGSTMHKVRFVCCGNRQGEDTFDDVFSPTTRFEALRTFLAVTTHRRMLLCQFDVSAAFLHADIDLDNVFVRPPEAANLPPGSLLKLRKSLYGLRQAPKLWYASVWKTIGASGFERLRSDACVFVNHDRTIMVCVHVDDFLIAATTQDLMDQAEQMLAANYRLKNLGMPKKYLSIAIAYDIQQGTMTLAQGDYVDTVLKQQGLEDCKPKATPLPAKVKLVPGAQAEVDVREYQSIIGSLLYLAVSTRPDISYATSVLSRSTSWS